jgi:predicted amidophosphoribosyltransferase
MLMHITPSCAALVLPFAPQSEVPMETFFLCKIEQRQGVSIQGHAGVFYYPAARRLMKQMLNFETVQLAKKEYERNLPTLSHALMSIIPAAEFDAIACVPSSEPEFLVPYRRAFQQFNPLAVDLSAYLSRPPGTTSTDEVPPETRLHATVFAPPADVPAVRRIIVIDDVLDTGVSAAAVAISIRAQWPMVSSFSLACAVWIVHTR